MTEEGAALLVTEDCDPGVTDAEWRLWRQKFAGFEGRKMLHDSAFDYLEPTEGQKLRMAKARALTKLYADDLDSLIPDGADKTYLIRMIRQVNMWAMVAITRDQDGSPR